MEAGRKNIEASVRDEPGVHSIYCAADKDDPNKIYVVEVYQDQAAYQLHADSPHFKAFIEAMKGEFLSRRAVETTPKLLGAKAFGWQSK
jgi:quinol monooxygenase YgiN